MEPGEGASFVWTEVSLCKWLQDPHQSQLRKLKNDQWRHSCHFPQSSSNLKIINAKLVLLSPANDLFQQKTSSGSVYLVSHISRLFLHMCALVQLCVAPSTRWISWLWIIQIIKYWLHHNVGMEDVTFHYFPSYEVDKCCQFLTHASTKRICKICRWISINLLLVSCLSNLGTGARDRSCCGNHN